MIVAKSRVSKWLGQSGSSQALVEWVVLKVLKVCAAQDRVAIARRAEREVRTRIGRRRGLWGAMVAAMVASGNVVVGMGGEGCSQGNVVPWACLGLQALGIVPAKRKKQRSRMEVPE